MKNYRGKVLIAAPVHEVLTNGLMGLGYECILKEKINQEAAYTLIEDCVGVITSTRLKLDKGLLDSAPKLMWIGRMGSGMEVIDLEYAAEKGVVCFGSPEGNCNAVGEHALGMLLDLVRRISWSRDELIEGIWRREENRGVELEGKTVGIIGYGHTGSSFAKKLMGFDVKILAYDKYHPENIPPHLIRCEDLTEIYEEADIVSFHVPHQIDTLHYFNTEFIAEMKKPFIFINTSRGTVADTHALQLGIETGKIIGICMDVFEEEPIIAGGKIKSDIIKELIMLPNVVFTPHIAGYTFEALYKMSYTLLKKHKELIF